ncbi:Sodium-coupled neutral amino acid transporter 9-like protein [Frankliniella fusca]|uniref:Sodium-coupled neutral amino acid transporter 9-like protein n=1 Tax=Frankliniella fusca TaxID=407009 RepID=A0AAE1LBU9_9NEOP|nr:Sodium-coupled neutral amino acid transporter 9-like protein [Frankliniella fusca]
MYDRNSRPSWRREADADSGSESQPLLSSDASRGSRRSFVGVGGIIFDSETSDFETGRSYADKQPLVFANQYQYRNKAPLRTAGSRDGFAAPGAGAPPLGGLRGGSGGDNGEGGATPYRYYTQLPPRELDTAALLGGQKPSATSPVFVPYLAQGVSEEAKQSSLVTIFAVWNTIMGTSLLAMPWGLERAGLLGGLLLIVGMGGLCLYTTFRVLSVHRLHAASHDVEVPELCRRLLGRWAELLARVFSLVVLLGAVIVYWILMSNFLFHSVDYIHDEVTGASPIRSDNMSKIFTPVKCHLLTGTENVSELSVTAPEDPAALAEQDTFRQWWNLESNVPIYLVLIMAPLMNFKSATFFTKFNSLGTLSVLYLLIFILVKSSAWGVNLNIHDVMSEHYSPLFKMSFPATSGMLALSYFIHNIIISIVKNNRHQENNGRDLSIAYVLVTITYAVIGGVFYIGFPLAKSCIKDNLLNNFESWDPMTVAARAFLFFQLVTVFPLVAFMLRSQICTMFLGHSWPGRLPVLMINSVFIVLCVLFAIYLPRFGTIIRFTGAISGLVYIFLLPVLLHLASLQRQGKLTKLTTILHMIIPVIGMANLIAQFFVSDE